MSLQDDFSDLDADQKILAGSASRAVKAVAARVVIAAANKEEVTITPLTVAMITGNLGHYSPFEDSPESHESFA